MIYKHCVLLLLVLNTLVVTAQNLVPNPGFEDYTCPTATSQIERATGWKNYGVAGGSPDYFNICSKDSVVSSSGWYIMAGVPYNSFGHQYPKNGNGYAGFCTYHTNISNGPYREIIGIELKEPLIIGIEYFVQFWISPAYGGYDDIEWFSNKIGLRFSMKEYDGHWQSTNPAPIDNFAHIYTDSIFTDTTKWHLVSGTFLADSAYPYLMLGNFFDNNNTNIITNGIQNYAAYYYIDDVNVSATPNSVIEKNCKSLISITPNPTNEIINIKWQCLSSLNSIELYDTLGRLIYKFNPVEQNLHEYSISTSNIANGTYYLYLSTSSYSYSKKVIIHH